ncbi:MAG: hypothetical protein KJO05_11305 [Bacteroidia bacterium]|nr:hypothetical protein [Bacteroidia bacterium]MBT8276857.1 hypothetical protein [Bacteroidia bacterium]NNF31007.1 hypothetical protein [Flavobacteriaceae bacterium]NNJ82427.1 hypothetical protein [Flavobacteriaceae bacterium]NNK53075.1 hypothetical protein [Flavobacteriaceae bacterium]
MIFILKGDIETGKSNALLQWTEGRRDVYGVLSPRNDKGERYVLNVNTKETIAMQAHQGGDSIISVGRYHFFSSAFIYANSVILNTLKNYKSGFVIIDELGKLEMNSDGLHGSASIAIQKTNHNNDLHAILVVRTTLLESIREKYNIPNCKVITTEDLISGCLENVTIVT